MTQRVTLDGQLVVEEDVVVNDSDKSFVVPADEEWEVLLVQAQLISTATVGNRQMVLEVQAVGGNLLTRSLAGATQAASLTNRYNFGRDYPREAAFVGLELAIPLPKLRLAAGQTLRVYDSAAVDAAADDMEVRVLLDRRKV